MPIDDEQDDFADTCHNNNPACANDHVGICDLCLIERMGIANILVWRNAFQLLSSNDQQDLLNALTLMYLRRKKE